MSLVVLPGSCKSVLWTALKAGVLRERDFTSQGTLQGGVISPLLCNIAFYGVEGLHNSKVGTVREHQRSLRYADDIIFLLHEGECGNTLLQKVKVYLEERGLEIKETKTNLLSAIESFDFLGWNFEVKAGNHKFLSYPSRKNCKTFVHKFKLLLKIDTN